MSTTAAWDLQKAIVGALRANATLMALVTGIFDEVPQDTALPYVVVGKVKAAGAPYFGEDAHDLLPQITTWTEDGADTTANAGASGYKQGLAIAAQIEATIMADGFTVSGHGVCVIRMEELETEKYDDPPPTLRSITQTFVIEVSG